MAVEWKKVAYEDDVITKALLTATGDIIYASAASTPARLAVGSDTNVLTLAAGVPSWAAAGTPAAHKATHENEGADEISVAGLSGKLADAQDPVAHAASHKNGQTDEILLHELGEPTGAVDINGQQLQNMVAHVVANAGARPTAVIGKLCWQTDTLAIYACTSAS